MSHFSEQFLANLDARTSDDDHYDRLDYGRVQLPSYPVAPALATTTACIGCLGSIPADGKHLHMCVARYEGKVVSREWVGFFDGTPICYGKADEQLRVEAELDHYVTDLLRATQIVTADNEAEQAAEASTEAPLLVEPDYDEEPIVMCDAFGCHERARHTLVTGEDSTYYVCCAHYPDITGVPCSYPPHQQQPDPLPLPTADERQLRADIPAIVAQAIHEVTTDPETPDPSPPPWPRCTCGAQATTQRDAGRGMWQPVCSACAFEIDRGLLNRIYCLQNQIVTVDPETGQLRAVAA